MSFDTRNPSELNHFKNFSSQWWNEKGPFKILHEITPLRMEFIKEKIMVCFDCSETSLSPLQGLRVLDVGCGGGLLCEPLSRLGAEVIGIDPIEENIFVAKAHAAAMGLPITYLSHTIEELPKDIPPFDIIIASEVIEHVAHPDLFLQSCMKYLKLRGGILVTTFNRTIKSYLLGVFLAEYVLKWAPRGTHSWQKFISPEELSRKFFNLGLKRQEITGLYFSPFTRSWHLSSYTDINYFLWAARN